MAKASISLVITGTAATPITMGETVVLTTADNGNGNLLFSQSATLSTQGTLQSLSFYVTTAAGNLVLGVYSNNSGKPGTLLAQTASFVPTTGWNTKVTTTSPVLAAGTYWLAALPSSSTLAFVKNTTGGSGYFVPVTFSATLPTAFPSGSTTSSIWSFYATLAPRPQLAAPTNLVGASGSNNITLMWSSVPNATGYTIFNGSTVIGTTTATIYTVTGLIAGTYTLGVEATAPMYESSPLTASPFKYPSVTPPAGPAVNSASFTIPIIANPGQFVGTMSATNSPTSWSIISSSDPSGNFAISNAGQITVTAAGVNNLTATGTQVLTVQATNTVGNGLGTATVHYVLQVPSVQSATFSFTTPVSSGFTVGTMTATNQPTSWSIISGDPLGDYLISNSGVITTAQAINAPVSEVLVVQATNAAGSSTGTATINGTGLVVPSLVQMIASATNIPGQTNPINYAIPGNNFKYTLPNPANAGNALLIGCTWPASSSAPTISDNLNGTWGTAAVTVNAGAGKTISAFFLKTGIAAGKTTITATFSAAVIPFQWDIFEFCNVNAANGTVGAANVVGPNLAAGSFTPGNNNGSGGNLIVSYFANSATATSASGPNPWTAGSGHTLLEGDMTGLFQSQNGKPGFSHAAEYLLQASAAAINPAIAATGDSTNAYNCVSIALRASATGQPAPSVGIYLSKVIHMSIYGAAGTLKMQVPWTGNLRFVAALTGSSVTWGNITDSNGFTWVNKAAGVSDLYAYAQNTTAGTSNTLTVSPTWGSFPFYSIRFYDITNASSTAFDNFVAGPDGGSLNSVTTLSNNPVITPIASNGLAIAEVGLRFGPGLSVTSPAGATFNLIGYTGEIDQDNYENADLGGHLYFSNTATQSWSWGITSNSGNTVTGPYAITFATGATAPPVVTNASFTFGVQATNGEAVGTITATQNPSSWAITAVSPSNALTWFAIDNSGNITVTAAGASNLTAGTAGNVYSLTCQATNGAGSASGTATCTAAAITSTAIQVAGQAGPGITINFPTTSDAGSLIGAITVTTNITGTYSGSISIGGTNASSFSLSPTSNVNSAAFPCSLYVSQTNLGAGSYSITLTATP